MLAIVSHLKDYSLCYHINSNAGFDLVKYEDLKFVSMQDTENSFSWYYYKDKVTHTTYYLIGNKDQSSMLIPSQKTVDYFLLIKDPLDDEMIKSCSSVLRKTPHITAVFDINMERTKDVDLLLALIELHELEVVK